MVTKNSFFKSYKTGSREKMVSGKEGLTELKKMCPPVMLVDTFMNCLNGIICSFVSL